MMERGFYHPERDHWQAIAASDALHEVIVSPARPEIDGEGNEVTIPAVTRMTSQLVELLVSYLEGTIEVPLKPGPDHARQDGAWVHVEQLQPEPDELRMSMPPITRRQLRLTLVRNGIALADVQAAIDNIPNDDERAEAQIEWDDATSYDRLHPTLVRLAGLLGLGAGQVDQL